MASRLAFKRSFFNTGRNQYNTSNPRVCNRQHQDGIGGAVATSPAPALEDWIQEISDRRGFAVDLLMQLCGGPASGKPIELWLPESLDTPEKVKACWGADVLARVAINRPPLRAIRFLNSDGSTFQVAFEARTKAGQWLTIKAWYEGAIEKLGDRFWAEWVNPSDRRVPGKYMSPAGKDRYQAVWLPDFTCAGKPIDWESVGGNKQLLKVFNEGPWKAVSTWFDLGQVPICLAGVDAAVIGAGHENAGQVRPEIAKLVAQGAIVVAFDMDDPREKPAAVKRVAESTWRLKSAIKRLRPRAIVRGWKWDHRVAKGIDDLVAALGLEGAKAAIDEVPLDRLIARGEVIRLTRKPDLRIGLHGTESAARHIDQFRAAVQDQRLVAIVGATGVGKTELLRQYVGSGQPLTLLSPRITLNRQAAADFGCTYRGDLPKAQRYRDPETGNWIQTIEPPENGRVATCPEGGHESLSPEIFATPETILISDEDDQTREQIDGGGTLRGKQLACFEWMGAMGRGSKQTVIASAGLGDDDIAIWEERLGCKAFTVVIERLDSETSYPVEMLEKCEYTAIVDELIQTLKRGETAMLACDSRRKLEQIKELIDRSEVDDNGQPTLRTEILTSHTAHDQATIDIIKGKCNYLQSEKAAGRQIHLLGLTSFAGTGFSLLEPQKQGQLAIDEVQISRSFDVVFGLFFGVVSPESARQMLNRYRQSVPRKIWCIARGARRGRASAAMTAKAVLGETYAAKEAHALSIHPSYRDRLLKEGKLDPDKANLAARSWANTVATQNRQWANYREYLAAALENEGRSVSWVSAESNEEIEETLGKIRDELDEAEALKVFKAPKITPEQHQELERKEIKTRDDYRQIYRHRLEQFYLVDFEEIEQDSAVDFILKDKRGSRQSALRNLSQALGYADQHIGTDIKSINRVLEDGAPDWSISGNFQAHQLLDKLKIRELIEMGSYTRNTPLIEEIHQTIKAESLWGEIRQALKIERIPIWPVAIVNKILDRFDLTIIVDGKRGKETYTICPERLQESVAILDRRFARWQSELDPDLRQEIEQLKPPPTPPEPEPIAQPEPTIIAQTKPAPEPIEFWTVTAGRHEGDRVRVMGEPRDGRQRVESVGRFGSFTVDVADLKPWQEPIEEGLELALFSAGDRVLFNSRLGETWRIGFGQVKSLKLSEGGILYEVVCTESKAETDPLYRDMPPFVESELQRIA